MKVRSRARDAALQYLYQAEVNSSHSKETLDSFLAHFIEDEYVKPYVKDLVAGVLDNLQSIDTLIEKATSNWRVSRMTRTDRNILRIATYELALREDIPYKVAINEGVELAKRFGSPKCPSFANGVLDKVWMLVSETVEKSTEEEEPSEK
jgi:transcription antitermination protein NusB